jgi:hypothetical protein
VLSAIQPSGEGLRSGGDDLVVRDVAQMLIDIP